MTPVGAVCQFTNKYADTVTFPAMEKGALPRPQFSRPPEDGMPSDQ